MHVVIEFPNPDQADEHGLLAAGGNLAVETLLCAYSQGIFPWYGEDQPILWWSPDPRMVLFADQFHCSRRLARRMRQPAYRFSRNEAFEQVISHCADIPRAGQHGTWIFPEMIDAYMAMHQQGFAHSFEVWQGERLIGGLYGVLHHQVFFGESMFSCQRDGSKMAMAMMIEAALHESWKVIDCQFYTDHLASLGGVEISRQAFLQLIRGSDISPSSRFSGDS